MMIPFTTGMPGEPIPYLLHTDWLITSILFLCMILTSLTLSKEKKYLLEHTEKSLYEGLKQVKAGARIGDIGEAVQTYAESHNLGVVKELVGHGIGNNLHEAPDVPNYGKKNTGPILKEGMVIAVEPMINLGTADVYLLDDDWTVVTADQEPSAHFEHTVLITKDGYEILTKR